MTTSKTVVKSALPNPKPNPNQPTPQTPKPTPVGLGMEVRDIVTGFTGIVVCRTEYIGGYVHFGVQPKTTKDTIQPDLEFVDARRLVVTQSSTPVTDLIRTR